MKNTNYLIENGVDLEESLSLLEDMETYDETLPNFKSSLIKNINNLKAYLSTEDITNYTIDVHSIKSNAKFFGFMKLAGIALSHEENSKAGNVDYLKSNFDELSNEINKTINIINTYLNSDTTKSNKKKVLVADDSGVVLALVKKILENDFDITTAENGEEVIKILEERTDFDAMLLDINMPKVDGFGVLSYMNEKDLFKDIPVSIISGNDDNASIEKAFSFPIVDMLIKPFNDNSMLTILNKTLGRKN